MERGVKRDLSKGRNAAEGSESVYMESRARVSDLWSACMQSPERGGVIAFIICVKDILVGVAQSKVVGDDWLLLIPGLRFLWGV